jgi:hypothetical protein
VTVAKVRSPNYPAVSLGKAIELTRKLYQSAHTHKTDALTVAKALGFGGLNGSSLTTISALKKYGLLVDDGGQLRISKAGLTILVDPEDSRERADAILKAAFAPVLFSELRQEYGDALPPRDEIVRAYLLKRGFAPGTVDAPIRAYRDTLDLVERAKAIYNGDNGSGDTSASDKGGAPVEASVGDLIQWESSGVLRLEAPRRVRAIREHEGSKWVFVEGSETGIPMSEVIIESRAETATKTVPPVLPEQEDMSTPSIPTGPKEHEWLRGPLSRDASYRILVSGDIGPKEIGKLITLLEAQKSVLSED